VLTQSLDDAHSVMQRVASPQAVYGKQLFPMVFCTQRPASLHMKPNCVALERMHVVGPHALPAE
jgi:hypothetical protein